MPAAAVIPAPIAYILVVAVKKLVVVFLVGECGPTQRGYLHSPAIFGWSQFGIKLSSWGDPSFTVKKLECSKQTYVVEYISME